MMKWLRDLSVSNKFTIIIGLILLILLFGLTNFLFGFKVMSSIRAYVGGEGLWSKAQKEATNNLIKYSDSFDEEDYNNYLVFLQVPMGDKQARLELEKENPNIETARLGFIKGGNHPEDVDDLIFLYRRFRNVSYMDIAIRDWTKGDAGIEELLGIGEKIHAIVLTSGSKNNLTEQASKSSELTSLVEEAYIIDKRLTILENHFSATLSEGSRRIRDILLIITVIFTIIIGSVALFIALYIGKITVRIDKMKSEFVSMVSHELRTPLTAIVGITSMILKGEYTFSYEKLKQPLKDINESSLHLVYLVNDLLEASRIQSKSGKLVLDFKEVNINEIIEKSTQFMQGLSQQKGIVVTFDFQETVFVFADTKKVEQILYNLLGNAIKFTSKGKIDILLTQKKDEALVTIKDTGFGIAKKDQSQLFGRFHQISIQNTGQPVGLGLGLYLSRELARRMGGDVWLEASELGKGSTFVFCLPRAGTDLALKIKAKTAKESEQ